MLLCVALRLLTLFCISCLLYVVPSFCFMGSLSSSDGLFDIIVDPRSVVDGGAFCQDVSSACGIAFLNYIELFDGSQFVSFLIEN